MRSVVAATAAARTSADVTARTALAASARVAPVVTTSSTMTTTSALASRSPRRPSRAWNAPATLVCRASWSSAAWSATRRRTRNAPTTGGLTPRASMTARAAARASVSKGTSPRRARAAGRLGTGTTTTRGPQPRTAPTRAVARSGAKASTRSRRSRSLYACRARRVGPSYDVAAHVGGSPAGGGRGTTTKGALTTALAHARHQRSPGAPHPPHTRGSTRSRTSARTEAGDPIP